jgi:hypothetical protein
MPAGPGNQPEPEVEQQLGPQDHWNEDLKPAHLAWLKTAFCKVKNRPQLYTLALHKKERTQGKQVLSFLRKAFALFNLFG